MKRLCILGSTGSIGRKTLEIVARFPERYSIGALTAHTHLSLLSEQIRRFKPELAVVHDERLADELTDMLSKGALPKILYGTDGYRAAAELASADMVVTAMVGAAGVMPTLAAIDAGHDIALANKETLVVAGGIVMEKAASRNVKIIPVDSEHSAIFQCLAGNRSQDVDKIILTASGGPFVDSPADVLRAVRPEAALKHPNWQMGPKITIDSATLMNKGLEVIEARWLFGMDLNRVEVVVHPQSIIHSMVAYRDGSILAQLGIPDMKGAIAYALSHPERLPLGQPLPDFTGKGMDRGLTFKKPDIDRFPCLGLAYRAAEIGGTLPAVMNAANEIAVEAFLNHRISFTQIPEIIRIVMQGHETTDNPDIERLMDADRWSREATTMQIDGL
jgi:1-deoxy-D-xylulose-5-phosphate reductoisomerase